MVLERLFRITLMLSKNSLAFRGHREEFSDNYNGNFLSQVELLSNYDPVIKQILDMPSGSIRYLSPTIQNEIIHCLGRKLLEELVHKINLAPFYSIMLDITQDISKTDQLSIMMRHVHIVRDDNLKPIHFEIEETFLGFFKIDDHTAEGMKNQVLNILREINVPLEKCYGQGYDGANVMSGAYNGFQKKIKDIQPNAEYVHCNSHNLNLIVNDSVNSCQEVMSFYSTLENIYVFFGNSVKRWDILSNFTGESQITLKKLNPTRWAGRLQSITAVKIRFVDILKALTEINLKSNKKEEREEVTRIKKSMDKFEFIFICVFLHKVMCEINYASKVLQNTRTDLNEATTALQRVTEQLKIFRNSYDEIKSEAYDLAQQWGINRSFESKRIRIVKSHYDELARDYRHHDREHQFKINVFYYSLDLIIAQIRQRFVGMTSVRNYFDFLEPKTIFELPEQEILKKCNRFSKKYAAIISNQLALQYNQVISLLKQYMTPSMSIKEFSKLLLGKYGCLESEFSEVYTAIMLFLTLPVTTASVERSFSKLKIIKDYKRNTMTQKKLHELALLAIEHKEAAKMDVRELIYEFANLKARKKNI